MKKNEVYVTTDLNDDTLWRNSLDLTDVHWINNVPDFNKDYQVRLRHRAELIVATLQKQGKNVVVKLKAPERAITTGQSAVIYDGTTVVGGGIVS
jgi:tRNA-specific 2-thiouridylase